MSDWGEILRRRAAEASQGLQATAVPPPVQAPAPRPAVRDDGPPVDYSTLPRDLEGVPVAIVTLDGKRYAVDEREWDAWWAFVDEWNAGVRARAVERQQKGRK